MEKLELAQLSNQSLTSEQSENCMGGNGGKVITTDLEGF
jgi:hypothetical protein